MAYINTITNEYPITEKDIRNLYPNTSFPTVFSPPEDYAYVFPTPIPNYDAVTQYYREIEPIFTVKNVWEQTWIVIPRFQEYIDSENITHTVKEQEDDAIAESEKILKDNNVRTAKQLLIDTDFSALIDVRIDLQNVDEFDSYRSFLRQIIINPRLVVDWPEIPTSIWSN